MSNKDKWAQMAESGARLLMPPRNNDTSKLSGKIIDVLRRGDRNAYSWWAKELGRLVPEAERMEKRAMDVPGIAFVAGLVIGVIAAVAYG